VAHKAERMLGQIVDSRRLTRNTRHPAD
jgi:hypothetical protein